MKALSAIILTGLLLASCAQMEARRQAEAQNEANMIASNEDATCRSYGAEPGTPAYIQCRMNFSNQRAQINANDRAVAMQYLLQHR